MTTNEEILNQIRSLLAYKAARAQDLVIGFPNNTTEMLIPASTTLTPVKQRIGKRLISMTVSIPENGIMIVKNNNIQISGCGFFSNESGTITLENGIPIEDLEIVLTNASTTTAGRFNYRLVFAQ